MEKQFRDEVKRWSPQQKKTYLQQEKGLGIVNPDGTGSVCDGTTTDLIDVDEWIVGRRLRNISPVKAFLI